jgi:hypothetical protein
MERARAAAETARVKRLEIDIGVLSVGGIAAF